MNLLSAETIQKRYGDKLLLENVSFGMSRGERIGLIGVNGCGKTTMLRILAGVEPPDAGRVVLARGARIAYLPQNPALDEQLTVLQTVFASDAPITTVLRAYEETTHALAHHPDDPLLLERLHHLTEQMDTLQAWEAETTARATLSRLGLADYLDAPLGTLSGGLRKRVALAQALIAQPDLLICDEPTNHLDIETIAWLETYFARTPVALLLVTHDRYFLDRIVTRMLELDQGILTSYQGNYDTFLEQKAAREAVALQAKEARNNLLQKELAWLRRGARARSTKQKAHVQRVHALMDETPAASQGTLSIEMGSRRTGKRILEIDHVCKFYEGQLLVNDVSLELRQRDRVGLIGPNGRGKSTLLNMIAGRVVPDSGRITLGETIVLSYYDQESEALDESQRVVDYIRETAELVRGADGALVAATHMLERFLFSSKAQWEYISTLSGGERRRLYLLRTLMTIPNLLLLDEPTNDLDIQTLTVLEDYLDTFEGTVIVVSHDRYFLDRTVERLLVVQEDGTLREYPGGYSDYEAQRQRETTTTPTSPTRTAAARVSPSSNRPRRLSYQERRELSSLERRIGEMEQEQTTLMAAINEAGSDYQRYEALAAQLAQLTDMLETAMERWAELAELAEQEGS